MVPLTLLGGWGREWHAHGWAVAGAPRQTAAVVVVDQGPPCICRWPSPAFLSGVRTNKGAWREKGWRGSIPRKPAWTLSSVCLCVCKSRTGGAAWEWLRWASTLCPQTRGGDLAVGREGRKGLLQSPPPLPWSHQGRPWPRVCAGRVEAGRVRQTRLAAILMHMGSMDRPGCAG